MAPPSSDPGPIFIVGAPRSGTSLLRVHLDRHPAIGLCDETYFFYYVARRRRAFGDLSSPANRRVLTDAYLATRRIRDLGLDLAELSARLDRDGTDYPAFFATILKTYAEAHGKARWGEKTPHHAREIETLCAWYPSCRIVHLVRDPRDVVASLLRMPWGSPSVVQNARLWRELTQPAGSASRGRPNHLSLRYEDLVEDPEATLRYLCEFLGEPFSPEMLVTDPEARAREPWFQRALGEVTRDRRGAWLRELSAEQARLVEWIAGPTMREHGYERTHGPPPRSLKVRGVSRWLWEETRERLTRAPRLWHFWLRPRALAAEEARLESYLGTGRGLPSNPQRGR